MRIIAGIHEDYFSVTPSISIGDGWILLDWAFFCIEILWGEFPEI